MKETCDLCNCIDDEHHRLNDCIRWRQTKNYDKHEKTDFKDVFSDDVNRLKHIVCEIKKVWNTQNAHGTMRTE